MKGKTVAKVVGKTLVFLIVIIGILILDVAVIRGTYLGLQYIRNSISELISDMEFLNDKDETEEETTAETEKRDVKELLKEEEEKLQEILEHQTPPKNP